MKSLHRGRKPDVISRAGEHIKTHRVLWSMILLFAIVYGLISLVNHYFFRTYALDLGLYTNALYDYIHFQWNDSTVFKEHEENLLADHFDLYLIIFSPLSLVFGTYTLLVVQIVALLAGGAGIYTFFRSAGKPDRIAVFATLYFYLFYGVYTALSFDYHSNVVAAALVPWFFYLVNKHKPGAAAFMLLMILVSKENMPLWAAFICLGLAIDYRKDRSRRNFLAAASAISLVFFLMITTVVMPAISNTGHYPHFHYSYFGGNYVDAALYVLTHPLDAIRVLFVNHTGDPAGDFVKAEVLILLLLSGLPFLFIKPQYLLMLLPIFLQKLYHDKSGMWGICCQYNIEFAPIMAIGIFVVISDVRNRKAMTITALTLVLLAAGVTVRVMDSTIFFTNKDNIRFYQPVHYKRDYNVQEVREQFKKIPDDAVVSAQSAFVPQLALRDHIYQFPFIKDAEYIVFSERESSYPIGWDEFKTLTAGLLASDEWEAVYQKDVVILKRRK